MYKCKVIQGMKNSILKLYSGLSAEFLPSSYQTQGFTYRKNQQKPCVYNNQERPVFKLYLQVFKLRITEQLIYCRQVNSYGTQTSPVVPTWSHTQTQDIHRNRNFGSYHGKMQIKYLEKEVWEEGFGDIIKINLSTYLFVFLNIDSQII